MKRKVNVGKVKEIQIFNTILTTYQIKLLLFQTLLFHQTRLLIFQETEVLLLIFRPYKIGDLIETQGQCRKSKRDPNF